MVVIESQAGAGKSTLLAEATTSHDGPAIRATLAGRQAGLGQLRRRLHQSLRLNGLSDLAALLDQAGGADPLPTLLPWLADHDEALLIVIDDVHLADEGLAQYLAAMVTAWPAGHRLLLAGRRIPDALRSALAAATSTVIDAAALRFTPDEANDLLQDEVADLLDASELARLTERCDGWAAAVGLAATRLHRAHATSDAAFARELRLLLAGPATLPVLLASLVGAPTDDQRRAVDELASLPMFDDELVEAAGIPGGVAALADLGLPLEQARPGLWTLSNAVRDVLAPEIANDALIRTAAQRYVAAGHPSAALEVLDATRLDADLAALLADLPPVHTGQIDPAEHAAAVGSLSPDLLRAHPRILIHLADSYLLDGHLEEYRANIRRARDLLDDRGTDSDDPDALEVLAADCSVRLVASDSDELIADAQALLARPELPPMARGRLLGAVGRATAGRRTAKDLRAGVHYLEEAAQIMQRIDAPTHAVATRVIAATVASWPLGRYDAALEQLDQALHAGRDSLRMRVSTLPYRAFILIEVGRYAEARAALEELRRTAATVGAIGNERSAAFARWGAAKLASQQGDAETTWAACRAVERSEVAVDTGHGAFFRADAAQLLARAGRLDDAERLLAEARQRDPGTTPLVATAEFVVAAYAGDHHRAEEILVGLDGGLAVEPRDRWRITLLHAHLQHLAGEDDAQSLAAAAFEEAAQLGYPDLPFIREPEVARTLQSMAAKSSSSARDRFAIGGPRVRVLGTFAVDVDGRTIEPTGRPAELVGFLALNGRQTTADQVIEALWPDADATRGRERLRTVLRRTRRDVGDLVERHDELLRLRAGVTVDADEFRDFVRQARDPAANPEAAAAAAIALYGGTAAPVLSYLDWAEGPRRHLAQQALAMHDVVAATAESEGRLDDAIRTLFDALTMDELAEDRYLVAARLLAEQGRRRRALQLLAEAGTALADAGLTPSPEGDRLRRYLERSAVSSAQAS